MPQKRALNLGKINRMARHNTPFEIHVHGEVPLRADVGFEQLQEALKPLWKYAGARSLAAAATSAAARVSARRWLMASRVACKVVMQWP